MTATRQTLFIGGKVFDGMGRMLPGHGVLVEGARVARVAPAGEFSGYAGARVDTTGMTLMPSLADCHVHLVYTGGADPKSGTHKAIRGWPLADPGGTSPAEGSTYRAAGCADASCLAAEGSVLERVGFRCVRAGE